MSKLERTGDTRDLKRLNERIVILPNGNIETWFLGRVIKMDIDMFLLCMVDSDYMRVKEFLMKYLQNALHEKISYKKYYISSCDYTEYIACSLFSMSIESKYTSSECASEFTLDEYGISTNVSIYINLFTATITDGICLIREMLKRLDDSLHINVIVEDHSSKAVYISSESQYDLKDTFWNPEK